MRRNLKKKAIVLVSILLVSYLVLGCAQRKGSTSSGVWEIEERIVVGTQEIPEYIREMVIANRVIEEVDNDYLRDNIDKFFYEYDDNKGEIPFNDLLGNERTSKTSVTVAEAIEDVNVLFSLFKFGYAGYQYFGGDKVFLAAKDRIIDNLNEVNEESIGRQAFARIILNEMCFIQDGHVSLKAGGRFKQFFKEHNMLFSDKYQFTKYESNFYTLINGEKFYLTSVDGKAPGEKMNLSINEAGEFVYFISLFASGLGWTHNVTLTLESGSTSKNIEIELKRMQDKHEDFTRQYELMKISGVHVLDINCMHGIPGADHDLVQFTQDAKELSEEEVIIIDLRGNEGGSDGYAREWMNNFTGRKLSWGSFAATLNSSTAYKGKSNIGKSNRISNRQDHKDALIRIENRIGDEKTPKWDFYIRDEALETVDNDTFVIVLIDSSVMSAGESFVQFLRQLNNVVFVGSNTNGVDIIGNTSDHFLPNSLIQLRVGTTMFHNPLRKSREGIGFEPDFWVSPTHSLERVIKMIKKYDVNGFKLDR